ncbi:hypothetical protein DPMN_090139 [Dreissena polymorpha]|uniref:Uncharacterized protein n=1 Tax=Dreissena polymorpha TaxID=45954 RepID=A0A9D4KX67_DREPO|nr:hypothetical protein DPMN_090139 [Dreissena polymorpha]
MGQTFQGPLNRPQPSERPDIPPADTPLRVNTNPPTKAEIQKALKALKNNKAHEPDGIPPEALKTDPSTTETMLLPPAENLGRRKNSSRLEKGTPGETSKERRPRTLQKMARHHVTVSAEQGTNPHHLGAT